MAEDDAAEFLKLAVEDRCVHKLWKARVSGYEEATKLFNQYDADEAAWKKFAPIIKKFVTDSNAVAQEKGLDAAFAFVENSALAAKHANDITEGCVLKCVGAPKTKTKDLAKRILLMLCEIEVHERVVEELIKGLAQKNPKVVSGCLHNMRECLHAFGAKVIKVSPLLKATLPLLDHRDKTIREEGKQLIVESYRWVGDIMKQQLSGLKPVQLTELETEFEKVAEAGKAKPERCLRSQMAVAAVESAEGGSGSGGDAADGASAGAEDEELDPYNLMDPVDILAQLPKNFYELVEEKKWQLRKEALDALLPLSQTPKITSADFNELVRVLRRFIQKDTNVLLVALAAQCLAGLAKGLRVGFKNHAANCLSVCLEKFKEKKANVVNALTEAVDALYAVLGAEAVQEDSLAALKHKTPSVIAHTAKFLSRAFAKCPPQLVTNKKALKGYVLALVDCLAHSDGTVRDSSAEALGVLSKFLGEASVTKLMPDVDSIKLAKIKEFAEKAELTGKPAAAVLQAAKAVKPPPQSGAKVVKPKAAAKPAAKKANPAAAAAAGSEKPAKPASAPPERKVSKPGAGRSGLKSAGVSSRKKGEDVDTSPLYTANTLKNGRFRDESKLKVLKWNFSSPRQEFVEQLQEQMSAAAFNSTLQAQMFNKDFKQHLKALESLSKHVGADVDGLIANLDLILKWLTLRFFETNPSVLLRGLDYVRDVFHLLSEHSYNLHDLEAVSFVPYLLNKSGDPKDQVRNSIRDIMKSLCHIYPAGKISPYLMESLKSKNAKQRTEALTALIHLIQVYGTMVLQPTASACLKEIAKQISDRDNSVRSAALNCIGETYFQDGEKMYKMIGNLPEKDMAMLEERIKRQMKTRGPPVSAQQPQQSEAPAAPAPAQQQASSRPPARQARPGSNLSRLRAPGRSALGNANSAAAAAAQDTVNHNVAETGGPAACGGGIPTTVAASHRSPAKSRPVSGPFAIDWEKIESLGGKSAAAAAADDRSKASTSSSDVFSKLVKINLDDVLSPPAHHLQPTLKQQHFQHGEEREHTIIQYIQVQLLTTIMSPVQDPTGVDLTEVPEAYEALDVVLAQILNQDPATCISALKQMEELIKDDEKVQLLSGQRMDQLHQACYMQYRHVLQTLLQTDNYDSTEVMRLFQYLTMVLMSLYHHAALTRQTSPAALHDLTHIIVCILLEPRVQELPQGGQLIRALNVLTVKIVERSDHTAVTCALLKLLKDGIGNASLAPRYIEMVMKCLWKVIRALPDWMAEDVDLDTILRDLHDFLKAYPSSFWKKQDSDTPMRTVKTILHAMAKARGDEILDHLTRIPDPESSELLSYLRKVLNTGLGKENVGANTNSASVAGQQQHLQKSKRMLPRLSKFNHDNLAEIFKKIGHKEQTRQGLQELYQFKQQNPAADLEPYLAKSSQYFRDYIENGLKSIENELAQSGGGAIDYDEAHVLTSGTANGGSAGHKMMAATGPAAAGSAANLGEDLKGPAAYYLDRLRVLRERAGLSTDEYKSTTVTTINSSSGGISTSNPSRTNPYHLSAPSSYNRQQRDVHEADIMEKNDGGPAVSDGGPPAPSQASTNLDDIRNRLAMIKQSSAIN